MERQEKKIRTVLPGAFLVVAVIVMAGAGNGGMLSASLSSAPPPIGGVIGKFEGVNAVTLGEHFVLNAEFRAKDPDRGAVFELSPEPISGGCRGDGWSAAGGISNGDGAFAILPTGAGKGLEVVPTDVIRFSYRAVAERLGSCTVSVLALDASGQTQIVDTVVEVVPFISLDPIDMGALRSQGGQTKHDEVVVLRAPERGSVTIRTAAPFALAHLVGDISHHDGWSWRDTGRFEMSPAILDQSLLPGLPQDLIWTQVLTDDRDARASWRTMAMLSSHPQGMLHQVCLHGDYYDNDDKKGSARNCVDVTVVRDPNAVAQNLHIELRGLAMKSLDLHGMAFLETGPGEYMFLVEG